MTQGPRTFLTSPPRSFLSEGGGRLWRRLTALASGAQSRTDQASEVVLAGYLPSTLDVALANREESLLLQALDVAPYLPPACGHAFSDRVERRIWVALVPPVVPDVDRECELERRDAQRGVAL